MATRQRMKLGEIRNVSISYVGKLDEGELLTGTPTAAITPATATPLAPASVVVSTENLKIEDADVPPGHAVQFKVSGGSLDASLLTTFADNEQGILYEILVTAVSDATPPQTFKDTVELELVAP